MYYNNLQRATSVTPSDTVDLIHPQNYVVVTATGTQTAGATYRFTISQADYEDKISAGDLLVEGGDTLARILSLTWNSPTEVDITFDAAFGASSSFSFYSDPPALENVQHGAVLYVGTGGAVAVETIGGDDVIFTNVANGTFIYVECKKVKATGTGASGILAIW